MVEQQHRDVTGRPNSPFLGWVILGLSVGLVALIGSSLGGWFVSSLGWKYLPGWIGTITGGALALSMFSGLVPEFFVRTRQNGKFVATTPYPGLLPWLSGSSNSIVFPEGTLSPTVPFLGREEGGNVSMEVNTIPIKFSAIGAVEELFFEGVFVYRVNPAKVTGFVGITDETIANATINQIKGVIGDKIQAMSLDQAKAAREGMNTQLTDLFSAGQNESPFEAEFCILVKQVRLSEVKGSPKLQKTRDARAEAEEMYKSAAALLGIPYEEVSRRIRDKEMSHGQLIDLMNILLGKSGEGSVTASSYRLAGTDGLEAAIGNALQAWLTKGGQK